MTNLHPSEVHYYGDLLYIEDYDTFCHTNFGKEIQSAVRKQLTNIICEFEFGFQDGGCLMLARAFKKWSGDNLDLYYIVNGKMPNIVQHVVASYQGKVFIDSDGLGTEKDFLKKSDLLEGILEPQMHKVSSNTNLSGIINDEDYILEISTKLSSELGSFQSNLFEEVLHTNGSENHEIGHKI